MMEQMGINIKELKERIVSQASYKKQVASATVEIPLSEETKRVLHYALKESMSLNHKYVGVEHILLGILRDEHAFASQLLSEMGADLYRAKERSCSTCSKKRSSRRKRKNIPCWPSSAVTFPNWPNAAPSTGWLSGSSRMPARRAGRWR